MKYILTSLILCLSLGFFAQDKKVETSADKKETTKKKKAPKGLKFKTFIIERNDIPYGTNDLFEFEFKNESKTPAIIQGVQTSCGCTTASKPEEPVKPGKSSKISVKYDTKRVGQFTKTITITSNVSEPIILTIKGTVLANPENNQNGDNKQPASH
jgi:hypothetical protein